MLNSFISVPNSVKITEHFVSNRVVGFSNMYKRLMNCPIALPFHQCFSPLTILGYIKLRN